VASNQKVPLLHAHNIHLRFHSLKHNPQMPMLTNKPTVNLNVR